MTEETGRESKWWTVDDCPIDHEVVLGLSARVVWGVNLSLFSILLTMITIVPMNRSTVEQIALVREAHSHVRLSIGKRSGSCPIGKTFSLAYKFKAVATFLPWGCMLSLTLWEKVSLLNKPFASPWLQLRLPTYWECPSHLAYGDIEADIACICLFAPTCSLQSLLHSSLSTFSLSRSTVQWTRTVDHIRMLSVDRECVCERGTKVKLCAERPLC